MAVLSAEQAGRIVALSRIAHASAMAEYTAYGKDSVKAFAIMETSKSICDRAFGDVSEHLCEFVAWSRSQAWRAQELQDRHCADDLAGLARREAVR